MKKIFPLFIFLILILPSFTFAAPGACNCAWWDLVCWIGCIFNILAALPFVFAAGAVVVISVALAFVGMILTDIMQGIASSIIASAMDATVTYIDSLMGAWKVIRDGTIWLFAVFLALIGLATIFRIETYRAKRALIPLLVIALLLNFVPFFVKSVVAIGNSFSCWILSTMGEVVKDKGVALSCSVTAEGTPSIGMNLFGNEFATLGGVLSDLLSTVWQSFLSMLFEAAGNFGKFLGDCAMIVLGALAFAIFWFAFAFALLILALVFIIRMVYIWFLFLASPIACATFAFRTREIKAVFPGPLNWEGWIEQLLSWSFTGVLVAFWIGVACLLIAYSPITIKEVSTTVAVGETFKNETFNVFMKVGKYIAALIALYLGITTGQTVVEGVTKGALAAITGVGALVALGSLRVASAGAKRVGGWASQRYPRLAEFGRATMRFAERMESIVPARGALEETLKTVPFAGKAVERISELRKAERERMEAAERRYKDMAERGRFKELKEELFSPWVEEERKAKILKILTEKRKIDDEIARRVFAEKSLDEIERRYGSEVAKGLKVQRPDLLIYVINPETRAHYTPDEIRAEIEKLSMREIAQISPDAFAAPTPGTAREAIAEAILKSSQNVRAFERESVAKRRELIAAAGFLWTRIPPEVKRRLTTHPAWQV